MLRMNLFTYRNFRDAFLQERDQYVGVCISTVSAAMQKMEIRKKTTRYSERNHTRRIEYLRQFRLLRQKYGKENAVYFDESGFDQSVNRTHGWATRGHRIQGDIPGRRHRRTNPNDGLKKRGMVGTSAV
ncbi:MAG: hypothetical protein HQL98_01725 [Magnetococcales bacterium]|nr:hypothetical protein [Magnetococcales bacterium]